jgi:hypothetical protein
MNAFATAIRFTILAITTASPLCCQTVKVGNCIVDSELIRLPNCAVKNRNGRLYITRGFLKTFFSGGGFGVAASTVTVDGTRLAWSDIPGAGWAYFDRSGLVVVKNVATMDNGASQFHHGLVRVTVGNKWGLANAHGKLVVPMKLDGALDYEEGSGWRVCTQCRTEGDGELSWFTGGQWKWLDQYGRYTGEAPDPMARSHQ